MLVHVGNAAKTLAHAYLRHAKVWVHTHKEHVLSRLITGAFNFYRHLKSGNRKSRIASHL